MAKKVIPRRRRGGRSRKAIVYDTQGLMALFEVETEEEVREVLANMGITPHESAGRLFVSDYTLRNRPKIRSRPT